MNGERETERGGGSPDGEEAALAARRRALEQRLSAKRPEEPPPDSVRGAGPGWAQGMRLASEFVAGVLVGAAIGWFFDRLLDTSPWGLIVFLLLGFAAGALNAMRAAGLVRQPDRPREGDRDGG